MSTDQDKLIAELVEKGLTGDMEPINSIEDRVLRSKAKAALVKAKRAAKSQETADSQKKKSEENSNFNIDDSDFEDCSSEEHIPYLFNHNKCPLMQPNETMYSSINSILNKEGNIILLSDDSENNEEEENSEEIETCNENDDLVQDDDDEMELDKKKKVKEVVINGKRYRSI